MTFRNQRIMKTVLRWFSAVLLLWMLPGPGVAEERPNILFCFADDWGRYAGAYAAIEGEASLHALLRTPNIDRVAREGVLFRRAFVNAPSCTPCRSALLSGRHFFATGRGAILQGAYWDGSVPSFPMLLADSGHHIGETWKVWSPGDPGDAPFGAGRFAYEKHGGRFNNFSEIVTKMVATGQSFAAARDELLGGVRGNFRDFLGARPPGRPWLYWFGPTNVHRAWQRGSGKALWGIDPEQFRGRIPAHLPDVATVREDFADYFGEIQAFDAAVGMLLSELESRGELGKTLIVISGDHGMPGMPGGKCNLYDFGVGVSLMARWPGGKGGRVVDDFVSLMDLAPTLLEASGVAVPPGMQGRSLLPILRSTADGQIDPARDHVITGRERHVAAAREGAVTYPQRALRTADYLYIRNYAPDRWPMGDPKADAGAAPPAEESLERETYVAYADMDASPTKAWLVRHGREPEWRGCYDRAFGKRPAEELYDLRRDPAQLVNVAAQPDYAAVRGELSDRLLRELKAAGDPRVTGDAQTYERKPFTGLPEPKAKPKRAK
jgi:arylsulfatase A-like enzyme